MQFGQVPTMFVPEASTNDTRSITVADDLSTLYPQDLEAGEMVMETPNPFADKRTWIFIGAIALLWWVMKK